MESNPTAEMCVFTCEPMVEALRGHLQVSAGGPSPADSMASSSSDLHQADSPLQVPAQISGGGDEESAQVPQGLQRGFSPLSSHLHGALLLRQPHLCCLCCEPNDVSGRWWRGVTADPAPSPRTEVLVKEGLSLQFATSLFQTWVTEKGISHISSALRKASLERRLLVRKGGGGVS